MQLINQLSIWFPNILDFIEFRIFEQSRGRYERYPSKFKNFCYHCVPDTEEILDVEYRWVLGIGKKPTSQIKNVGTDGYRVPARKNFGYRWVPSTGQI